MISPECSLRLSSKYIQAGSTSTTFQGTTDGPRSKTSSAAPTVSPLHYINGLEQDRAPACTTVHESRVPRAIRAFRLGQIDLHSIFINAGQERAKVWGAWYKTRNGPNESGSAPFWGPRYAGNDAPNTQKKVTCAATLKLCSSSKRAPVTSL